MCIRDSYQSGHTLGIIASVDTCAYHVTFVFIQKLVDVFFVRIIVFAENHELQVLIFVNQGKSIEPVSYTHLDVYKRQRA